MKGKYIVNTVFGKVLIDGYEVEKNAGDSFFYRVNSAIDLRDYSEIPQKVIVGKISNKVNLLGFLYIKLKMFLSK